MTVWMTLQAVAIAGLLACVGVLGRRVVRQRRLIEDMRAGGREDRLPGAWAEGREGEAGEPSREDGDGEAGEAAVPQTQEEKDEALFREMHQKIVDGKLFLDPDFSRDKLVRLSLTNKNKVASLLRTYAHNNFNGYVNELRMAYAERLLRRDPDITVKALAIDSGFNSLRTFYRMFQQKYGMTPAEYKAKCLEARQPGNPSGNAC